MHNNYFKRLEALIGKDSLKKLQEKSVLVIGVGGVGGYVVESLVRSGIGSIILVDYDIIDETNINRQIIALNSTIGKEKINVLEKRINDINPNCKVIKYLLKFNNDTKDMILSNKIDFVVDSCDDISAKKLIIKEMVKRKIDFISCMGTAKKINPLLLEITDLSKTYNDPIARILRNFVRKEKIGKKIKVLSSREVPIECGNVLGSNIFVPSTAGLIIGSYVINELIK